MRCRVFWIVFDVEIAAQDTRDVPIEDRSIAVERDARDSARRVAADAGERQELVHSVRGFALKSRDDFFCGAMKIVRAGVIAGAFPGFQHSVEFCRGERADGGEAFEEALVVGDDGRDLRLLEERLRNPNAIRIVRVAAPGEIAFMPGVPREEGRGKCFCARFRGSRQNILPPLRNKPKGMTNKFTDLCGGFLQYCTGQRQKHIPKIGCSFPNLGFAYFVLLFLLLFYQWLQPQKLLFRRRLP